MTSLFCCCLQSTRSNRLFPLFFSPSYTAVFILSVSFAIASTDISAVICKVEHRTMCMNTDQSTGCAAESTLFVVCQNWIELRNVTTTKWEQTYETLPWDWLPSTRCDHTCSNCINSPHQFVFLIHFGKRYLRRGKTRKDNGLSYLWHSIHDSSK